MHFLLSYYFFPNKLFGNYVPYFFQFCLFYAIHMHMQYNCKLVCITCLSSPSPDDIIRFWETSLNDGSDAASLTSRGRMFHKVDAMAEKTHLLGPSKYNSLANGAPRVPPLPVLMGNKSRLATNADCVICAFLGAHITAHAIAFCTSLCFWLLFKGSVM